MKPTVGVIGCGAVGQAVGAALVVLGLCDRLLLVSRTAEQATALRDDLDDMRVACGSPVQPYAVRVNELRNCTAVVIAVRAQFTNSHSTDVRMGGAEANASLIRTLAVPLRGYAGTVLMVTNPVDLMTRLFADVSGCARVFGVGSALDTARYRLTVGRLLGVPVDAVRGHVIGEHGDAAVICASSTTVNGMPVPIPLQQVRDELARRPGRISAGIGRTRYGPTGAVVSSLRLLLGLEDGTTELSAPLSGHHLGIPLRCTRGVPVPSPPPLDPSETQQFEAARVKLRTSYSTLPLHQKDPVMTTHAVRLQAADAAATVISAERAITDWAVRYFGPWWKATEATTETRPLVIAHVDRDAYAKAALAVTLARHTSTTYAKALTLVARDDDAAVVRGVSPGEGLAYHSEPECLTVTGCEVEPVTLATARLAREVMRGVLLRSGWSVLHASAVTDQVGRTVLAFGQKGSGKTTTALTLACRHGFQLLANDRVFVRPDGNGGVDVLPWPSATAIGLGLLDALGWFDTARDRLKNGEALHPTQDARVTSALLSGRREPLREDGKELKAQVFPDQFASWFGLSLATGGKAAALVFPRVVPGAAPARESSERRLNKADFMSGSTEDRYPDVFALARVDTGGTEESRREVTDLLARLPHHPVALGHDLTENAGFLAGLVRNRVQKGPAPEGIGAGPLHQDGGSAPGTTLHENGSH
ncbi:lactate/malate family dehydrogenase [Streptomyces acidiscabies]|uniref:lactate/malate family dehydrogenase n=1 Tax=Streptomyces acidiscabies TaxID=42234 RepID=UPI0038F6D741